MRQNTSTGLYLQDKTNSPQSQFDYREQRKHQSPDHQRDQIPRVPCRTGNDSVLEVVTSGSREDRLLAIRKDVDVRYHELVW